MKFYTKVLLEKKAKLEKELALVQEKMAQDEKELALVQEKMAQVEKDLDFAQKFSAYQEYIKIVKNPDLIKDYIKKNISEHDT